MYARAHSQAAFPCSAPDCLPPSQPPKDSRLDAESLQEMRLPSAPETPPVIRGAAAHSIYLWGWSCYCDREDFPWGWAGCHLGLFCPKVSGLLAKALEGLLSQTCLCRSNPSFSQESSGSIPECAIVLCSPTPLTQPSSPAQALHLRTSKEEPGAWDGNAAGTGDFAGLRIQEHRGL